MSDPRTYEQLLASRLQRDARHSEERVVTLEQRISELTAELVRPGSEFARARAELAEERRAGEALNHRVETMAARQRVFEEKLRGATSERDAALRAVDRQAETLNKIQTQAEDLTELQSLAASRLAAERDRQLADKAGRAEALAGEYAS